MRDLNTMEIEHVSGSGVVKDIVDDIAKADFVGAYENIIDGVSHVIERVANAMK